MTEIAEQTVQQEDTPQPPPVNPPDGIDDAPLPKPVEQQKDDTSFFTSVTPHFGHLVSSLAEFML
jgi:hypothetical protein